MCFNSIILLPLTRIEYFQSYVLIYLVPVLIQIRWVLFLSSYSFKPSWLRCSYLHLLPGIWWNTSPITFQRIWLVITIHHEEYTKTKYPYIPGGFYYSSHDTAFLLINNGNWSGIKLYSSCMEVIIIWICSARTVPVCDSYTVSNYS